MIHYSGKNSNPPTAARKRAAAGKKGSSAGRAERALVAPCSPKDTEGTFQPLCAYVWPGVCGGVGEKMIQRGAPETETNRR